MNNTVYNLFLCQLFLFVNKVSKSGKIHISLNGYDFSDDYYNIEFTSQVKAVALNNPDNEEKRAELMKALADVEVQKIEVTAPHALDDNIQL